MKNILLVVVVAILFISGCSSDVHEWYLNRAAELCGDSGIDYITANTLIYHSVICKDGGYYILKNARKTD